MTRTIGHLSKAVSALAISAALIATGASAQAVANFTDMPRQVDATQQERRHG